MRKNVALLGVLVVLLSACDAKESTATPVDVSALQTAAVQTVLAAANQTATANVPTNTLEPTLAATMTTVLTPTSTLVEGWLTYSNAVLRYELSYPPEAILGKEGVTGYPAEELPPNMTVDEYFTMLKQLYPGDLCVGIQYQIGYIAIQAPPEQGGKYSTPCGLSGLGVVDVIQKTETAIIDGRSYSATGYEVHQRDAAATFVGEYFTLQLEDGNFIHYGGFWTDQGQTHEDYLPVKEILLQILATYRSY
jgi:hypothetical protein